MPGKENFERFHRVQRDWKRVFVKYEPDGKRGIQILYLKNNKHCNKQVQLLGKRKPRGQPHIKDILKKKNKNIAIKICTIKIGNKNIYNKNITIKICILYKSKLIKMHKNHRNIFNKL